MTEQEILEIMNRPSFGILSDEDKLRQAIREFQSETDDVLAQEKREEIEEMIFGVSPEERSMRFKFCEDCENRISEVLDSHGLEIAKLNARAESAEAKYEALVERLRNLVTSWKYFERANFEACRSGYQRMNDRFPE
jgi:hypothetical protein